MSTSLSAGAGAVAPPFVATGGVAPLVVVAAAVAAVDLASSVAFPFLSAGYGFFAASPALDLAAGEPVTKMNHQLLQEISREEPFSYCINLNSLQSTFFEKSKIKMLAYSVQYHFCEINSFKKRSPFVKSLTCVSVGWCSCSSSSKGSFRRGNILRSSWCDHRFLRA